VTRAWSDELVKGKGGLGLIIVVLRYPIHGLYEAEPVWVMHPTSHKKHLVACGAKPKDRLALILDQAIAVA